MQELLLNGGNWKRLLSGGFPFRHPPVSFQMRRNDRLRGTVTIGCMQQLYA
jgi:hypothetical protein